MDKKQWTTWPRIPVTNSQNSFNAWRKGWSRDPERQIPITNFSE
jgi:hypothetical protein